LTKLQQADLAAVASSAVSPSNEDVRHRAWRRRHWGWRRRHWGGAAAVIGVGAVVIGAGAVVTGAAAIGAAVIGEVTQAATSSGLARRR